MLHSVCFYGLCLHIYWMCTHICQYDYEGGVRVIFERNLQGWTQNSVQLGLSQHICLLMLTQHNLLTVGAALLPADCSHISHWTVLVNTHACACTAVRPNVNVSTRSHVSNGMLWGECEYQHQDKLAFVTLQAPYGQIRENNWSLNTTFKNDWSIRYDLWSYSYGFWHHPLMHRDTFIKRELGMHLPVWKDPPFWRQTRMIAIAAV